MKKVPSEMSKVEKKPEEVTSFNTTFTSGFFPGKTAKMFYDTTQNFKHASFTSYGHTFTSQKA